MASLQVYDIFGPNKSFSKTRPDQPAMHICLSHGARIPTRDEIAAVQRLARHPVYFAHVVAGDMMYAEANVLHGITNTGTTMMTFYFTKLLSKNGAE